MPSQDDPDGVDYAVLGSPDSERGPFLYGDPKWERRFPLAEWSRQVKLEGITCPRVPGHQRAGERTTDLDLILPTPKVGDFLWTWYSDCIITDRVLTLFREAGLTGFDVRPVTVSRIKRRPRNGTTELPRLWELVVTGRGGDADPASGIRLIYRCQDCGLTKYSSFRNGIIVDQAQWDGSDLFTVNGYPRFILVTPRVAELIIAHRLTNCALIPSGELQWLGLYRAEDYYKGEDG
jgi:hypothetical protein